MKNFLFIALLSLTTLQVAGQTENVDSLENVLKTQKLSGKEQLDIYAELCRLYTIREDDKRLFYAETGLTLAEKEKDKLKMLIFNDYQGKYYFEKGEHDIAFKFFKIALNLAVEIKNKEWEGRVYSSFAVAYSNTGDLQTGIAYYQKAISCYESIGMEDKTATMLANMGGAYRLIGEPDLAERYLKKAENIAENENDRSALLKVYASLGNLYSEKNELDVALEYGKKALAVSQELGSKSWEANACQTLTLVSIAMEQYDEAEKYADECLRLAQEVNNKRFTLIAWNALSNAYLFQERFKESEDAAYMTLETDSTNLIVALNAVANIVHSNIIFGNKEKAIAYFIKYEHIASEINSKNVRENLMEMEVKYETEKKEIRIASLEKERRLYVWLGVSGIFLAVSLAIVLILTIRNARKKRQLVATEALQEGEVGERTRIAKDLHDRLGGSLSAVKIGLKNAESLQIINNKIDTCVKELREIMNNIMPVSLQKHGLKGAFEDFCIEIPNLHFHFFGEAKRIHINQEYALYCCARELVSNALKHSGANNMNLQLVQSRKHVSLTVHDDGCGFDEKSVLKGYGLENIRNRVTACRGKLDIASAPGKGTETVIELKIENVP